MAKQKLSQQTKVWLLPIEQIVPSPFQARTNFDEVEIKKLAVSILQNGLLQPISVRPLPNDQYQLIAGERRLRACRLANMETIPAIIYHFEDEKTAALSLLENLQREQLGPFEQARALRDILNLWNCTQEAGARRLGIAQPTLANKLRLLTLTQEQEDICTEAGLTERHARAVLRLPTSDLRTKALKTAAERGYNVQQTEALVARALGSRKKHKRTVMVRDVRIFVNTIDRAVKLMTGSGIHATAEKHEEKDYIEYVVRIPTDEPAAETQAEGAPEETIEADAQELAESETPAETSVFAPKTERPAVRDALEPVISVIKADKPAQGAPQEGAPHTQREALAQGGTLPRPAAARETAGAAVDVMDPEHASPKTVQNDNADSANGAQGGRAGTFTGFDGSDTAAEPFFTHDGDAGTKPEAEPRRDAPASGTAKKENVFFSVLRHSTKPQEEDSFEKQFEKLPPIPEKFFPNR